MNKSLVSPIVLALTVVSALQAAPPPTTGPGAQPLFDGKTLNGWEGAPKLWKVVDGVIVGGSLTETIPQNEFLATERRYTNFVLRLQFRLRGGSGFINSGVQIRSERVPNSSEMAGYQCDIGEPNWWASLYDESRRNRVLAWSDIGSLDKVIRRNEWNDYIVLADGARVSTWINGVQGVDYYEPDPAIAGKGGRLGFQVHGGGAAEGSFRNITIEELPARPRNEGAGAPPAAPHPSPLSPEEQERSFSVPPGFRVELVAAEPDGGKFVPIAFDHAGRLWTASALDYPIDANESPAEARALFERGGKDRILVFDTPTAPGRQKARVFAEGLAMPLGLHPYLDGAYAQYGSEIRRYRDTDGDGKADRHEVVLKGFGIEDSHLFPHQFTRLPGNWFLLAQGAFNNSKVVGADGITTEFNKTKMARFRPDGSRFETVGWGPCNIWGLVFDRHGEMFIQEANDQGWPMMPFLEGGSYPLCGDDVPRPFAPPFPKTAETEMGGTGLSGLALSEGSDSFPAPWRNVFFLANPITRKIQAIRLHRGTGAPQPEAYANGWQLEHLPDFVLSSDPWFRPVAISMGPDGCLYIVDWYNQIISHNEVPRNHPERDKVRGRIWRVRHESQPHRTQVPDLAKIPEADLLKSLAAPSTWEAQAAWQQIIDRKARALAPQLSRLFEDTSTVADLRIRSLWALEGLRSTDPVPLQRAFESARARSLRKEILRVYGDAGFDYESTRVIAARGLADPDRVVRQEAIRVLGRMIEFIATDPQPTAADREHAVAATSLLLQAAAGAAPGDWPRAPLYFRDFERYLVRLALEKHRGLVARYLDEDNRPLTREARALGAVILGGPEGARRFVRLLPTLDRGLNTEELLFVAGAADEPAARQALQAALALPPTLQLMYDQRARVANPEKLAPLLVDAVRQLLRTQPGDPSSDLAVRLASGFRLSALEPELTTIASTPKSTPARQLAVLRALREAGSSRVEIFTQFATSPDDGVRKEAIAALAAAKSEAALPALLGLWPNLTPALRKQVVDRLASAPESANRLVAAIRSGDVPREDLDGYALDKLTAVLPSDAFVQQLAKELGSSLRPILRLNGTDAARIDDPIQLPGAFTVETWIRLEPGLSNTDSLLGGPGFDLNFFGGTFRAWVSSPHNDIVVATKPTTAEAWVHLAVTRDAEGRFRIYVNGELDQTSKAVEPRPLAGLHIADSTPQGGTAADLYEYRIWNVARTADQIRYSANLALKPGTPGVLFHGSGESWGQRGSGTRIERTGDLPPVQTEQEAAAMLARFDQFRALAAKPGDVQRGRQVFATTCGICHSVQGQGGKIGPALDGAGVHGNESLLRNILTPNAAMEAGYRRFRIETQDGEIHEGLLAASDATSLTLRQPSTEDRRFLRTEVRRSSFLKGSVMPEGLLEAIQPTEVTDLFAYLRTLGTGR
jgi:putative membrane-bound dehydrogenase-like protein